MSSNICTILEQRRQLALLKKPANRYEGAFYNNPYESVSAIYTATNSNNTIKISGNEYTIPTGNYKMFDLIGQLNLLTKSQGYLWSDSIVTVPSSTNITVVDSTANAALGLSSGTSNTVVYNGLTSPVFPITIDNTNNIINLDNISFSILVGIYANMATLIVRLNSATNNYGYSWSSGLTNKLSITKNLISTNLITLTNTNSMSVAIDSGSTLFGINSGAFVSPCVLPIPTPAEDMKAPGFTKDQLDMRRKAEVLQYKKTASQTGQMSKKGKYAKLFTVAGNNNICPLDLYLPTPSSSSNIPGPSTMLQYNESIPLYNYASDADNYANLNPDENDQFDLYADNNILVSNGQTVKVASLLINNPSKSLSTFAITIPIGLYVSADISSNTIYDASFSIPVITFGVYYNGSLVPGTSITTASFSNKIVRVESTTSKTIFSGATYIGGLSTTFTLATEKGFVYEFRMTAATALIQQSIDISPTVGMFVNISNNLLPKNCSIQLGSGGPLVNPGKITVTVS